MSVINDEDKRKHLEFIQNIITRMNSNSFLIKGWSVTIVSALLALFASTKEEVFLIITLLPIVIFWWLDTRYLQMERKFRSIYKKATSNPPLVSAYDLNIEEATIKNDSFNRFWANAKSDSILPFYLFLFILSVLCVFALPKVENQKKEPLIVNIKDTVRMKILDSVNLTGKDSCKNKIENQDSVKNPKDSN